MMTSQVMQLVDEIRRRRLSRNKHFTLFCQRDYREARRIQRYLDGLATEIEKLAAEGGLMIGLRRNTDDNGSGRVELLLAVERLQLRRHCYLTPEELDDLCRTHPVTAELIAAATGQPQALWANDAD